MILDIEDTLKELCVLFDQNAREDSTVYYFSKLSVLELCGWIEYEIDDAILTRFFNSSERVKNEIQNKVRLCYGFKYSDNICPLIQHTLGIEFVEKIELQLGNSLVLLKSDLGALAKVRDNLAHTFRYSKNVPLDAPTKTLSNFYRIKKPLVELTDLMKNTF